MASPKERAKERVTPPKDQRQGCADSCHSRDYDWSAEVDRNSDGADRRHLSL